MDHDLKAHGKSCNEDNVITSLVWASNDEDNNWLVKVDIAAGDGEANVEPQSSGVVADVKPQSGGVVADGEAVVELQTGGDEVPEEGVKKRKPLTGGVVGEPQTGGAEVPVLRRGRGRGRQTTKTTIGWQKLTLLLVTVRPTSSHKVVVLWPAVRSTSSRKSEVLRSLRKVLRSRKAVVLWLAVRLTSSQKPEVLRSLRKVLRRGSAEVLVLKRGRGRGRASRV
ncbi:hypothetical protein Q3G72_028790 [Acer saccharum]|nr:hypothetical protein Q3G72_028790 [Acer saccharum]